MTGDEHPLTILLVTVPGFDSRTCQVDWCRRCRCSFYHFLSWDTQRNLFRGTGSVDSEA